MENILTDIIGIVEDQPTVREALAAELARSARQVLVWASAEEAVRSPQLSSLTFLCLDLGLPHMSGVDFIRWLRQNGHEFPILVISSLATEENIIAALTEGAMGFVSKDDPAAIPEAIQTILSGGALASPTVMLQLLQKFRKSRDAALDLLSARERQVADLYIQGRSRREIAEILNTSENTVKNQIAAIYRKVQAENKMDLARRLGRI